MLTDNEQWALFYSFLAGIHAVMVTVFILYIPSILFAVVNAIVLIGLFVVIRAILAADKKKEE